MNWIRLSALSVASFVLVGASALQAKDEVRVVSESRVDAAKGRLREKTATEWMTEPELKKLNDEKRGQKQQLIYFEYKSGSDKWRGIYTDKVLFAGFSWWIFYGKNEMEAKVNKEMESGLQPAFIARSGNAYAMLFVNPAQFAEARKVLDDLGVGEPKLRK